ncbi:MAG: LptE family protein [Phycisphaeraceae bacterium]|nr:LptE family protein [Phycisphaeraceae bacterium]
MSGSVWLAGAGVLCLLLGGCGYGQRDLYDPNIRTVSVPIFKNKTFQRDVEFMLTEALKKQIESRTPYKVTASGSADTILHGTVVGVRTRGLSRDFDSGLVQEAELLVTVSIEWKDLRDGKTLRKRQSVTGSGTYVPTRGVGEPVEKAYHQAIEQLSWQILAAMRRDW